MEHENPIRPIPTRDQDAMTEEQAQEITAAAYERLRTYPDRTLAQLVIADRASDLADLAMSLVSDRDGRDLRSDVDTAARLVQDAKQVLEATVLAARLGGQSWDAIGEDILGAAGKKQTMINRYGALESQWRDALLEPITVDLEARGGRGATTVRTPDALSWDLKRQAAQLQKFLDQHRPDRELGLPEEAGPSSRIADYLWRLNAAIERFGVTGIPAGLAADLDARKAETVADSHAYLAAAERAAGKTETGEEA